MDQAVVRIKEVWDSVLDSIRTPENQRGLRVWLDPERVQPLAIEDQTLILSCPTVLMANTIRDRYAGLLCEALHAVGEIKVGAVVGRISGEASREHQKRAATVAGEAPVAGPAPAPRGWGRGFKLLQDFVVGSCNRLAYDAVMRLIEQPSDPANPLFIHGSSGLGKTHLIQGLAVAFRDRHPSCNVQYLRCEQFTNDFIAACLGGGTAIHAFRVKLRHADLLLLDDIHFLSRTTMRKSKDEIFETFNELTAHGKKVVITSDAAPSDIKYLEDRFVQRFAGGLVAPLDRPDVAVRRDIIQVKAQGYGVVLPEEVVDYIAEHITDNVRELEGAVNKLVHMGRSFRRKPDLALVRQALNDLLRGKEEPRLKVILRAVADYFELAVEDLIGKSRSGARSKARHVAMSLHKNSGGDTYAAVGSAFGGKSHSAVAYACEQVLKYRAEDANLDAFIEDVLRRVSRR